VASQSNLSLGKFAYGYPANTVGVGGEWNGRIVLDDLRFGQAQSLAGAPWGFLVTGEPLTSNARYFSFSTQLFPNCSPGWISVTV